jgi:molybdopterin-guanine dinucleotide biosynthesis protein A
MFDASRDHSSVVAHDGIRQQNLHLLLHESVVNNLRTFLRAGRYEVYRWLEQLGVRTARFTNAAAFTNINSFRDLKQEPAC